LQLLFLLGGSLAVTLSCAILFSLAAVVGSYASVFVIVASLLVLGYAGWLWPRSGVCPPWVSPFLVFSGFGLTLSVCHLRGLLYAGIGDFSYPTGLNSYRVFKIYVCFLEE
jgi:hypothetical protein